MESLTVHINTPLSGQHVDIALFSALNADGPKFSRRQIRRFLDAGQISVNGKRIRVASTVVRIGDRVRVDITDQPKISKPTALTHLEVVYDRDGIVAINKPPGLLSEATEKGGVKDVHVIQLLRAQFHNKRDFFLCHRLDRETSGILLVATSQAKAAWLNELFRERKVHKTYLALCNGIPKKEHWEVECFLSAIHKQTGKVRACTSGGRPSRTTFELVKASREYDLSLVRCHPYTGRSHQLRVHLEMSGIPILGDKKYGNLRKQPLPAEMQQLTLAHHLLHAHEISFQAAPDGEMLTLRAELPPNFAALSCWE